jgi:diguanylate cyclase
MMATNSSGACVTSKEVRSSEYAEAEWTGIAESASEVCKRTVERTIASDATDLATHFYEHMMSHPQAKVFLDHDSVHRRLHGTMMHWLVEIFKYPMQDVSAVVAIQRHIGEVHARIRVPVYLAARGARLIKKDFGQRLGSQVDDVELRQECVSYVSQIIDLAMELMSESYEKYSQRGAREDESYRLNSVGQNIAVERERQRAVLLEWGQEVLFTLHRSEGVDLLPSLGKSEFGLWFSHKASAMFEDDPDIGQIEVIVERIDTTLLPILRAPTLKIKPQDELIRELQNELNDIKFHLTHLFDRHQEAENGRDTLTRLLNRKFLSSVMNREIKIAQTRNTGFALLLLDLDHFKHVNDAYGHDAGDQVLQQVATVLLGSVRNGDFIFRYGGEELLVMLVEVSREAATRLAELIRLKIETTPIAIGHGRMVNVTSSVGVAMYSGHPDHQYLIKQADEALYSAKQQGRNRVVMAA